MYSAVSEGDFPPFVLSYVCMYVLLCACTYFIGTTMCHKRRSGRFDCFFSLHRLKSSSTPTWLTERLLVCSGMVLAMLSSTSHYEQWTKEHHHCLARLMCVSLVLQSTFIPRYVKGLGWARQCGCIAPVLSQVHIWTFDSEKMEASTEMKKLRTLRAKHISQSRIKWISDCSALSKPSCIEVHSGHCIMLPLCNQLALTYTYTWLVYCSLPLHAETLWPSDFPILL